MLTLFKLFASIFIITLVSLISLHQPALDLCLEMTGLQFLSIQNPSIHFQVNPAIENYVRRLPNKTDHFVLIFMETFAEASDSPSLTAWLEFLSKPIQSLSTQSGHFNLLVDTQHLVRRY